jgi:predicted nucleotidyltransferase
METQQTTQLEKHQKILEDTVEALRPYHPKTILLFGSLARHLANGLEESLPQDIDILVVGYHVPPEIATRATTVPIEVLHFRIDQIVAIARSLRYDPKPVALSKLYGKNVVKSHARDVIAASLLLGPGYGQFGIQQIEIEALPDERDYSVHEVLLGRSWWKRLCAYARQRRGPFKLWSDKIAGNDHFNP